MKYYDKEHNQFTEINDFSYQKNIDGILDIIKKHYSYFPLFFKNLDYIKENKDIDINIFFDILQPNYIITGHTFYNFHTFSVSDFDAEIQKMIPFVFYYSSAISNLIKTKKPIKIIDSISLELSQVSNSMLEKMESDLKLYREINTSLF